MKGLCVLKKLLLRFSLLLWGLSLGVLGDELRDFLSEEKQHLFGYEYQNNALQSDILQKSWINPVMVQYTRSYSEQMRGERTQTGSFSIGIDQPIFKSGGIYFAIKYAEALRGANEAEITLKKREMIGRGVELLFEMKKLKLEQRKIALLIQNDKLDIIQKKERYHAGVSDSSLLDQAILKANQDEIQKLQLEISSLELEKQFALLSDSNPHTLKLPTLKLISLETYRKNNLALQRDRLRIEEKHYSAKMAWTKYLPTVSVQGRYTDADLNPLFARPGLEERYNTYGFTISMPLSFNALADVEASKVAHLKAQSTFIEQQEAIGLEYALLKKRLGFIDRKIALARRDKALYQNLYTTTKNLAQAGEKTSSDVAIMRNSLQIRKLNIQIYNLEKQIELLGLYTKVSNAV